MREIKFKVWCKDKNEWEKDEVFLSSLGGQWHTRGLRPVKPDNHIVVQSTGLKDKNGVEIFENDIIRAGDETLQVVFYNGAFGCNCLRPSSTEDGTEHFDEWHTLDELQEENYWKHENPKFDIEVLGNLFELPHLLKEGEK